MVRKSAFALLVALSCSFAARGAPLDFVTPAFQAGVNIDPTGHVASVLPIPNLPEAYAKALQTSVMTWQFVPLRKNGRAMATTTWLRVKFHITLLKGGNAAVQVLYVGNGPRIQETHLPYPPDMKRTQVEARFYMLATVEPDGSIDHISLAQAFTSQGKPAVSAAQTIAEGISHWKAQAMIVDGVPVATRVIIPIGFNLYERDIMGRTTNFSLQDTFKQASDSPNLSVMPARLPEASVAVQEDSIGAKDVPIQRL